MVGPPIQTDSTSASVTVLLHRSVPQASCRNLQTSPVDAGGDKARCRSGAVASATEAGGLRLPRAYCPGKMPPCRLEPPRAAAAHRSAAPSTDVYRRVGPIADLSDNDPDVSPPGLDDKTHVQEWARNSEAYRACPSTPEYAPVRPSATQAAIDVVETVSPLSPAILAQSATLGKASPPSPAQRLRSHDLASPANI